MARDIVVLHDGIAAQDACRNTRGDLIRPIRPIRLTDTAADQGLTEDMSHDWLCAHFIGGLKPKDEGIFQQLVDVAHRDEVVLVAQALVDGAAGTMGAAHLRLRADDPTCEFAVVVCNEWRHTRVGMLLNKRVIDSALARGVESMYAIEAAGENLLGEFARNLGHKTAFAFACDSHQILQEYEEIFMRRVLFMKQLWLG